MIVSIDGLSLTGKSELSKMVAKELGCKSFDTGNLYRCIAYELDKENINMNDNKAVVKAVKNMKVDLEEDRVLINGVDVTSKINSDPNLFLLASQCAANPDVKDMVERYQRKFARENDAVIEGRDIGEKVVPNADIKFYFYSDFRKRVNRMNNLLGEGDGVSVFKNIPENIKAIDDIDINSGNFYKPTNAVEIDTTDLSNNEILNIMMDEINKLKD